jgi:iron complex outermembrane receptor protein
VGWTGESEDLPQLSWCRLSEERIGRNQGSFASYVLLFSVSRIYGNAMRTIHISIFMLTLFASPNMLAQQGDTLLLPTAEIQADRPLIFSIGNSTLLMDSAAVATAQGSNLGALLSMHSSLFVKSYGAGGSSTLSARGTEARHTSLFWNGLNISSPTLGLSDLSMAPVAFCEKILIVRGGSSAINGSSAIGGSVHLLSNDPVFEKQKKIQLSSEVGSFGTKHFAAASTLSNKILESKTHVFYGAAENNFKFINRASRDFPKERLQNASNSGFGILQDLKIKTGEGQYFGLSAWYQTLNREIPPLMTDPSSSAIQNDSSLRLVSTYRINKSKWGLHAKGGIFYEYQRYEDPEYQIRSFYPSRTLTGDVEWRMLLSRKVVLSSGINYAGASAQFKEYGTNTRHRELLSMYAGVKFNHQEKFKAQLNFRKEMLYTNAPALIPQLGLETSIYKKLIVLRTSMGRNYHIPSMNDLYWVPGGNPDLAAEDAWNLEAGLEFKHPNWSNTRLIISAYQGETNNWIRWQPAMGGIYSPDNLRKVETRGGELSVTHRISFGKSELNFSGEYSFVSSILAETYHSIETHLLGNDLMYIPNHKATAFIHFKRGNSSLQLNHAFTGSRYTDADNTQWIEGFTLADLRLEHWIQIKRSAIGFTASVNNLYNSEYQIMPYRPMPGRWFTTGIKFLHNHNTNNND